MTTPLNPRSSRALTVAGKLVLTLALGGAGGGLFAWLGAPAAWISGAMIVVAAASVSGLPVAMPEWARTLAFILLGTTIGAAVTPESLAQIRAWPGSVLVLSLAIAAMIATSTAYLTRVRGWEDTTARFTSIPGALSQVFAFALRNGADLPRIALAQSLRLFVLVALMPWLLSGGIEHSAMLPAPPQHLSVHESIVVLAIGTAFGLLLERLKAPGGVLVGAMIASAALHGAGLVTGQLPEPLLIVGFAVTGCVIGVRFGRISFAMVRGTVGGALESVMLAMAVSAVFALIAHHWLGLPFGQLWLAYAPGGVEAMTIMAFALGADPAFVGAHQVVRLILLNLFVPLWFSDGASLPDPKETRKE